MTRGDPYACVPRKEGSESRFVCEDSAYLRYVSRTLYLDFGQFQRLAQSVALFRTRSIVPSPRHRLDRIAAVGELGGGRRRQNVREAWESARASLRWPAKEEEGPFSDSARSGERASGVSGGRAPTQWRFTFSFLTRGTQKVPSPMIWTIDPSNGLTRSVSL